MNKALVLLLFVFLSLPLILSAEEATPAASFWAALVAGGDLATCDTLIEGGYDPIPDAGYFCDLYMDKINACWDGFEDYIYYYDLTEDEIAEEEYAVEQELIDLLTNMGTYEIPLTNKDDLAEAASDQWLYYLQAEIEGYTY